MLPGPLLGLVEFGRHGGEPRLSPDGKRAPKAQAWLKCRSTIDLLRTADQAAKAYERRRLEPSLLGVDRANRWAGDQSQLGQPQVPVFGW